MKLIFKNVFCLLMILIIFVCCDHAKKEKIDNTLFQLDVVDSENFVSIKIPDSVNFSFPDETAKKEPYKYEDFNADGKQDILVYLGACGTGGCMYGLFLNEYENYYTLAFLDYLKGAKFEKDESGFVIIKSFEEVAPYNPSKLNVSVYAFDKNTEYYKLDSIFVLQD
ncbi:hypothetical protein [Kordia sp.]|uniref:hypothetical protein n=1 Tax=Kordia sp. TaxID=1965332 RepID=UPI003D293712